MVRWLILALLPLAFGCAGSTASRGERLADAYRVLQASLLVRDYRTTATLLDARLRAAFLAELERAERNLSISELELLSMTMSADGERAETVSRITYFELPSTVLRTETLRVFWVFTEKEWIIEGVEGGPLSLSFPPQNGISSSPSPNPPTSSW